MSSELSRGPYILIQICKPEIAIKNFNRGLLTMPQLIDHLRNACINGKFCPYDTCKLFVEATKQSITPEDLGAKIFNYSGILTQSDIHEVYKDDSDYQKEAQFKEWHNQFILDN